MIASNKRAIVFAHYDMHNVIDEYVYIYLKALRQYASKIVFVSTINHLTDQGLTKLKKYVDQIILRENSGYDFMSFKVGLQSLEPGYYDEVILCNDSVYGPVYSLEKMFQKMDNRLCDIWGITANERGGKHLQSYFLAFRRNVMKSNEFIVFWTNVCNIEDKQRLIKLYEIGMSQHFINAGYLLESYIPSKIYLNEYIKCFSLSNFSLFYIKAVIVDTLLLTKKLKTLNTSISGNITTEFWRESLIHLHLPVVKIMNFRNNIQGKSNILRVMQKVSDYPIDIIEKHLERVYGIK